MHSIWTRANTIFAFTLTILSLVTLLACVSSMFFTATTNVTITAENPRLKKMADYTVDEGESDLAMMSITVDADFSSVFNWNVKELFVYLVAEYKTEKNNINQVVLWDKIIMRNDVQRILKQHFYPKYYFLDDGSSLLNHQNVTLVLRWNIVPNAGYLALIKGQGSHVVKFPSNYVTGRSY